MFKEIILLNRFKMFKEIILLNRYGDMMSRPGSMMMGGGIGGYMPMSRSASFFYCNCDLINANKIFLMHLFQGAMPKST